MLLLSACITAREPTPPFKTDKPLGPCDISVQRVNHKVYAVINRAGGDGYASGAFNARIRAFVSGSFGKASNQYIGVTVFAGSDQPRVELTGPDGFTVEGGASGSCEAFATDSTNLADDSAHECIRGQTTMSINRMVERCGRVRSAFSPELR